MIEKSLHPLGTIRSVSHSKHERDALLLNIIEALAKKAKQKQNFQTRQNQQTMEIDKNQIEYVVGIDLGHGETSAAICPLQWDENESQWAAPTDVEMESDKKAIPSAITLLPNGDAYIGEKAFEPENLKQAEVHVCFKKKPENIDGESEGLMIRFMHEVYKLIRERTLGMLSDGNHLVYIATPSGWDETAQGLYKQMAEKAGLPIAGVTKESRAAFVHGLNSPTARIARAVEKGAIVFDMGSSTLDFTYMNTSEGDKMIDFGYDCGASAIEKNLYEKIHNAGDIEIFEAKYPKLKNYLLFLARQAKETVYSKAGMKVKEIKHLEEIFDDDDFEETMRFVFLPGELNQQLEEAGYIQQIRDAMTDFVKNHINGARIYGVFLTGGASRMDFIKPLVTECFKVNEDAIVRDQDPSISISQGVAEVARMDLRTEGTDKSLSQMIEGLKHDDSIFNTFVESYSHDLCEKITTDMGGVITAFRDSEDDYSLNTLTEALEETVSDAVKELDFTGYITGTIESHLEEVHKKVESIVQVYSREGINVTIPSISVTYALSVDTNMSDVISGIREAIISESSGWNDFIVGGAIGLGAAFLLGGPLGWLAGGGYLLYKAFFGHEETEEEKQAKAMAKELNKEERQKVFDSLAEKWEETCGKVYSSIEGQLSQNDIIKRNIKKAVSRILGDYEQALRRARILVD